MLTNYTKPTPRTCSGLIKDSLEAHKNNLLASPPPDAFEGLRIGTGNVSGISNQYHLL